MGKTPAKDTLRVEYRSAERAWTASVWRGETCRFIEEGPEIDSAIAKALLNHPAYFGLSGVEWTLYDGDRPRQFKDFRALMDTIVEGMLFPDGP